MARCKSLDVLEQTILDSHMEDVESSDSDTDSEGNRSLIVDLEDGENEDIILSSDESTCDQDEKPVTVSGPVLSLDCLHVNSSEVKEVTRTSESKFIDPNDVQDLCINIDEEKEHPYLEVLPKRNPSIAICPSVNNSHSAIPARNDWDGAHNFTVKLSVGDPMKKSECSVFSEERSKLYVSKDYPFKVLVSAENVPVGSMIKAHAVFKMLEHAYETVQRCPTHAQQDFTRGLPIYEHFVQCFSDTAVYEKDRETGKLSVSVPFEKPKEGETFSTYLFKLTCFSSCSGGVNRRNFKLVFTLENDDVPLGRKSVEAKVCACPMRDFRIDSEKADRQKGSNKKIRRNSTDSNNAEKTKYSIVVKDPELYLFLKQMKSLYETNAYVSKLKSDT